MEIMPAFCYFLDVHKGEQDPALFAGFSPKESNFMRDGEIDFLHSHGKRSPIRAAARRSNAGQV